ncbi:hypothetical protein L3Q82_003417 [Scortum barcoo]|uniref:Uncharacterized protein n=1 Tax=Scortum barcoo TaxID=214431 RepID=A0ACB8VM45_9TELE|nr:hypothetical protein L3Q82_003417 [Scortum barcoo]
MFSIHLYLRRISLGRRDGGWSRLTVRQWRQQHGQCRALTWAEARFAQGTLEGVSYRPSAHFCASSSLLRLSQGRRSVEEYTIEFRTLAVEVDWTQDTLRAANVNGLSEQMKDELVSRDDPQELNDLITFALRIDARLQARLGRERRLGPIPSARHFQPAKPLWASSDSSTDASETAPRDEPMQVGRARQTPEERREKLMHLSQ